MSNHISKTEELLNCLIEHYPDLISCRQEISDAFEILKEVFLSGGKLLLCGSGGSASDCLHIVGELMKSFVISRNLRDEFSSRLKKSENEEAIYLLGSLQGALPAIALVENSSLMTAVQNDIDGDIIFAQQVYGLGRSGDALLAISTSGNSRSAKYAIETAKALDMKTIGLTGASGGCFTALCDCTIKAPVGETSRIQEYHLPIYHTLCMMLESFFFS